MALWNKAKIRASTNVKRKKKNTGTASKKKKEGCAKKRGTIGVTPSNQQMKLLMELQRGQKRGSAQIATAPGRKDVLLFPSVFSMIARDTLSDI